MDVTTNPSAIQQLLKMLHLSNSPPQPSTEEEVIADTDEPPDHVPEIGTDHLKSQAYRKSTAPQYVRRESLLTRAINAGSQPVENKHSPLDHGLPRALSTASSQSVPSTAELTSDCDLTSPARSASPSPPFHATRLPHTTLPKHVGLPQSQVVIAPASKDDKPAVIDVGEAAVEKSLGRKRCIMFACADSSTDIPKVTPTVTTPQIEKPVPEVEPAPRKCRLTFACPTRQDSSDNNKHLAASKHSPSQTPKARSPAPTSHPSISKTVSVTVKEAAPAPKPQVHTLAFHEFGSSHDETDAWVYEPAPEGKPKLTLDDVMKKENAIRQIAREAEEEADDEDRAQEEMEDDDLEDGDIEDDFAPSDDDEDKSDGGNESDDEGGFADSDDESDGGSEYRFWAPSTTTAATSTDNLTHISSRQRSKSRSSSLDSTPSESIPSRQKRKFPRRKASRPIVFRPSTPELPDSTDFVCGTLDEDRPLEAAYISCRDLKKAEKHIPIPQDIDPSFPTSDIDDEEDDEDLVDASSEQATWMKDQFGGFDEESRGRRSSAIKLSPTQAVPIQGHVARPLPSRRTTNRSPPPPTKHNRSPAPLKHNRSPPPRRLFGHSPAHHRFPPARGRLHSPRGSPTNVKMPLGITINRLAQRPNTDRTASLPHTPNPFFRNWEKGSPVTSRIQSAAITPAGEEGVRSDGHVRGPVDIVIGLEKKRQKRKEKFWRQHCRKAAKEQAERKPVPGRGVERMKELGLESAERSRGYNLGQQAQLVISL